MLTLYEKMLEDTVSPPAMTHATGHEGGNSTLSPGGWSAYMTRSFEEVKREGEEEKEEERHGGGGEGEERGAGDNPPDETITLGDWDVPTEAMVDFDKLDFSTLGATAHLSVDTFTWKGLETRLDKVLLNVNCRSEREARDTRRDMAMVKFFIAELQSDQELRMNALKKVTTLHTLSLHKLQQGGARAARAGAARERQAGHERKLLKAHLTKVATHLQNVAEVQGKERRVQHRAVVDLLVDIVTHTSEAHKDIRLFAKTYHDQQGIFSELLTNNQRQLTRIYEMHAAQTQGLKTQIRELERELIYSNTALTTQRKNTGHMKALVERHLPHLFSSSSAHPPARQRSPAQGQLSERTRRAPRILDTTDLASSAASDES